MRSVWIVTFAIQELNTPVY